MCIIASAIGIGFFYIFQLYNNLWKYASLSEMFMIGFACLGACGMTYLSFRYLEYRVPFSVYMLYGFMIVGFTGLNRIIYRVFRRYPTILSRLLTRDYRRVMVVGAGEAGAMVIKELQAHPEIKMKPVVVVDDDIAKHKSRIKGVRILGDRNAIPALARELKIDEIIIAMPSAPKNEIRNILDICKTTRCKLKTLPGVYELIDGKVTN